MANTKPNQPGTDEGYVKIKPRSTFETKTTQAVVSMNGYKRHTEPEIANHLSLALAILAFPVLPVLLFLLTGYHTCTAPALLFTITSFITWSAVHTLIIRLIHKHYKYLLAKLRQNSRLEPHSHRFKYIALGITIVVFATVIDDWNGVPSVNHFEHKTCREIDIFDLLVLAVEVVYLCAAIFGMGMCLVLAGTAAMNGWEHEVGEKRQIRGAWKWVAEEGASFWDRVKDEKWFWDTVFELGMAAICGLVTAYITRYGGLPQGTCAEALGQHDLCQAKPNEQRC